MGVDFPDGHKLSVIRGWDGTTFRNIKVSSTGELYILLSALYNSTIKALKCDAQGNAFLNIKAQDLAEVMNRPKYGACHEAQALVVLSAVNENTLVTVSGKGITYGGFVHSADSDISIYDSPRIYVDGILIQPWSWSQMMVRRLVIPQMNIIFLVQYDITTPNYTAGIKEGITFESSLSLRYNCADATARSIYYSLIYALV